MPLPVAFQFSQPWLGPLAQINFEQLLRSVSQRRNWSISRPCAIHLCGNGHSTWFDHGPISDVAKILSDFTDDPTKTTRWLNAGGRSLGYDANLLPMRAQVDFGKQLRNLYDLRQLADYFKPSALQLSQGDARSALQDSERVLDFVQQSVVSNSKAFDRIAFVMLSKSVRAKNR